MCCRWIKYCYHHDSKTTFYLVAELFTSPLSHSIFTLKWKLSIHFKDEKTKADKTGAYSPTDFQFPSFGLPCPPLPCKLLLLPQICPSHQRPTHRINPAPPSHSSFQDWAQLSLTLPLGLALWRLDASHPQDDPDQASSNEGEGSLYQTGLHPLLAN